METRNLCWIEKDKNSDKKSYHKVGVVLIKEDGNISVRLNMVPRPGVAWDGWMTAYKRKEENSSVPEEDTGLDPF